MKRIDDKTVEFDDPEESLVKEEFDSLLDQGKGMDEAIAICTEGRGLTVEFIEWLRDG